MLHSTRLFRQIFVVKSKPRIGAVSYLNTKPLVEGLDELANDFEIVFDLPSRLADRLHRGGLDVALIPSIEVIAHEYSILSDACIACRGEVWSVKLMCRNDKFQIESLALDEGSRTSSALAKIILAQKFDTHPELLPLDIKADWRESKADAVLIIGDRAMNASDSRFPFEYDLGKLWYEWTGLSFVFAVWAGRESGRCTSADLDRISVVLSAARDQGIANIASISELNAEQYGLSLEECQTYFNDHLHFNLGQREKMGLEMYYRYASRMMLIQNPKQLQFHAASIS